MDKGDLMFISTAKASMPPKRPLGFLVRKMVYSVRDEQDREMKG